VVLLVRALLSPLVMVSHTPTLLDPFEVAGISRQPSLVEQGAVTEWFDRATLPLFDPRVAQDVEELRESPPWTPEPVDRRWRARGWTDE
jgi:hypothetical protein